MSKHSDLVGVGLYSLPEAAALTGVSAPAISRWVFGYTSRKEGERIEHLPVWTSQLAGHEQKALGFLDLLEVRFVAAFKQHGVSLQAIRTASRYARECFNSPHPFACREFKTDGRTIFAEVIEKEEVEDHALIDLVKRQYAFKEVITPSLYRGIEYGEQGTPLSWHPNGNKHVILDPQRAFGRPIDEASGIPTEVLYSAYQAEEDIGLVARLYEVEPKTVKAAVAFEQGLRRHEVLH